MRYFRLDISMEWVVREKWGYGFLLLFVMDLGMIIDLLLKIGYDLFKKRIRYEVIFCMYIRVVVNNILHFLYRR